MSKNLNYCSPLSRDFVLVPILVRLQSSAREFTVNVFDGKSSIGLPVRLPIPQYHSHTHTGDKFLWIYNLHVHRAVCYLIVNFLSFVSFVDMMETHFLPFSFSLHEENMKNVTFISWNLFDHLSLNERCKLRDEYNFYESFLVKFSLSLFIEWHSNRK